MKQLLPFFIMSPDIPHPALKVDGKPDTQVPYSSGNWNNQQQVPTGVVRPSKLIIAKESMRLFLDGEQIYGNSTWIRQTYGSDTKKVVSPTKP